GIKKPADFVKAQKFRAAGLGISSSKDVRFRLSFDILGLKYDYVTGYNSSSDARLAVQRNEAQYHDETLPSYRAAVEPQMVKTGMVTPIYYTDLVAPNGEILVSRDVPELQPFSYYYKEVFGKPPSGIKSRQYVEYQYDPNGPGAAESAARNDYHLGAGFRFVGKRSGLL